MPLERFMEHRKHIKEIASETYKKIMKDGKKAEDHLEELEKKLEDCTLEGPFQGQQKNFCKPVTYLQPFATNINVTKDEKFERARREIGKLPECLKPNGAEDLMHFGAGSINLNVGPGSCLWISCPIEYFNTVDSMLNQRGGSWTKSAVWPLVKDLRTKGIFVEVYEQMAGDMVYVGFGTPHWVQSVGFADNISWNIVVPTVNQLATAALIHDYHMSEPRPENVANWKPPIMPLEYMIWNMVIKRKEMDGEMKRAVKSMLMRSLANAAAEEAYAIVKTCPIVNLADVPDVPAVARCYPCDRVLFNYLPVHQEGYIICFQCYFKRDEEKLVHVVQRYEMKYLVELFDSVIIN
uniref:JmjC domain-containing protein n=1 Tax=Caenorhabditis tropicalis TaxID=1561998 RepID=A0A1I7TRL3_9PELO